MSATLGGYFLRFKTAASVLLLLLLVGPPLAFLLLTAVDVPFAIVGQDNGALELWRKNGTFAMVALLLFTGYVTMLPLVLVPAMLATSQTWRTGSFGVWTILIGAGLVLLAAIGADFGFIGLTRLHFFISWIARLEQYVWAFLAIVAALWLCRRMLLWAGIIREDRAS